MLQYFVGDFARLYLGANCSHAVHNLLESTVWYTGAPTSEKVISHHPGTSSPTLSEQCVGSSMSHTSTVRRGLRFIVLIREDLKV